MGAYRKKPVVIQATQFTEEMCAAHMFDGKPLPDGVEFAGSSGHRGRREVHSFHCFIKTLEGRMDVQVGDWIITGVKGEHYPCEPDIFEMTYEAVGASNE